MSTVGSPVDLDDFGETIGIARAGSVFPSENHYFSLRKDKEDKEDKDTAKKTRKTRKTRTRPKRQGRQGRQGHGLKDKEDKEDIAVTCLSVCLFVQKLG